VRTVGNGDGRGQAVRGGDAAGDFLWGQPQVLHVGGEEVIEAVAQGLQRAAPVIDRGVPHLLPVRDPVGVDVVDGRRIQVVGSVTGQQAAGRELVLVDGFE